MNSRAFVVPSHLSTGAYFERMSPLKPYIALLAACNRAVWYVKKGRKKTIVKFANAGPGGLKDVKAELDKEKVC